MNPYAKSPAATILPSVPTAAPFNHEEFELRLTAARYKEGVELAAIHFDPKKHPRNLLTGEFRDVIKGLATGGSVKLPSGTTVKSLVSGYEVDKTKVAGASEAADLALEKSGDLKPATPKTKQPLAHVAVQNAKPQPDVETAAKATKQPMLEPKYDGWRILAFVTEDGVRMISPRNWNEYTGMLPEIEAELAKLPVGTVVDGEAVAITQKDGKYVNEWSTAQKALSSKTKGNADTRKRVTLVLFDALNVGDENIKPKPLSERRTTLAAQLTKQGVEKRWVDQSIQVPAVQKNHDLLVGLGFEGSMVKDNAAAYHLGKRGHGWFKVKAQGSVDGVIMGFKEGENEYSGMIGSLIWGQPDASGKLVARGHVGSGFTIAKREEISNNRKQYLGQVIEIRHMGIQKSNGKTSFRHPTLARWREDKAASEVHWHDE